MTTPAQSKKLTCFKAYDVRGRIGDNFSPEIARQIGNAFACVIPAKQIVVGHDCRQSSPEIADALIQGLLDAGVDVLDIGLCGTEEVYFATDHLEACGGVMVTASHNPIDWNGLKLVGRGAKPLTQDQFDHLTTLPTKKSDNRGTITPKQTRDAYVRHIETFVTKEINCKIVANVGNGTAGGAFGAICEKLALSNIIALNTDPDGTFPKGIPNPLLPENRSETAESVRKNGADMGIAWDGDFDRCFFFDEKGDFIDGEYIVALLAQAFLSEGPQTIVHDPRVQWNTQNVVADAGGKAVASKTGHAFLKAAMRETNAIYGGEMSAHHYFREFMFCDSGMIPWLLVAQHLSASKKPLSEMVQNMRESFPSSGEINFVHQAPKKAMAAVEVAFGEGASIDTLDGLSLAQKDWRVNLRSSNTEPLLRLNVETRGDKALLDRKVAELSDLIKSVS